MLNYQDPITFGVDTYMVHYSYARYKHNGVISPKGGMTSATIIVDHDENDISFGLVATAICPSYKPFIKKVGRQIAHQKLVKKVNNFENGF